MAATAGRGALHIAQLRILTELTKVHTSHAHSPAFGFGADVAADREADKDESGTGRAANTGRPSPDTPASFILLAFALYPLVSGSSERPLSIGGASGTCKQMNVCEEERQEDREGDRERQKEKRQRGETERERERTVGMRPEVSSSSPAILRSSYTTRTQ